MNIFEQHPEDLLEGAREDSLSPEEWAELREHAASCAACRFELSWLQDEDPAPDAADEAHVERVLAGVLDIAAAPPARRLRFFVAAAAMLVVSLGGGAYAAVQQGWTLPFVSAPASAPVVPKSEAPPIDAPAPAPELVEEAEPPQEEEASPPAQGPSSSERPAPTAASLYAEANAARRSGDARRAMRLYRRLTQDHPRARETQTASIAAGNLALHELGDARGALRYFERYLRSGGPLAVEARVGKALCLGRLGRTQRERAAWEDVVRRHPRSVHAERARRRLESLSP